jgi:cardiolipin synthase (CMP-forming)
MQEKTQNAPIVNPANILTFTRILVLPFVFYAFATKSLWVGAAVAGYSVFVDGIDGSVARYFKCQTVFGEFLDAASDALYFLVVSLSAAYYGYVSWSLMIIFLALGALNAFGRVIFVKRTGLVTNFRSYASETLGGLSFFLAGSLILDYYVDIYMQLLIIYSFILVIHDYYRILTWPLKDSKNG